MDIADTIKETQGLLAKNPEWRTRYAGYANSLGTNIDFIKKIRRKFKEIPTLPYYISTTNAKNAKSKLLLDLRYRGQSVATLKADDNKILVSTEKQDVKNKRDFDCDIKLLDNDWGDKKARKFRSYFKGKENKRNDGNNKRNDEHHVESMLLAELEKRKGNTKPIVGIQPVKICGNRFGMPTPLSASDHNVINYSGPSGGGIDIFARTGKGRSTYLTVIEVKDENKPDEKPMDALQQAIHYTVFIRELLRSSSGDGWYNIFGFKGKLPKTLKLRAVCAMPDDIADKSFERQTYQIGQDEIECHYIYFKYDGKQLSDFQTSL